jgi:feruloyl esterase
VERSLLDGRLWRLLKRGYAAISHDSGHQAKSWETHWARDREALDLWAHKVLPVVAGVGNSLIVSLYGEPAHHRYFSGCSNGGRLGLMAAQRYPDLFDGIAAGGSIFDLSGIAGLWGNWLITQTHGDEDFLFPPDKVPLIKELVMRQCDDADGQKDSIISDPRACRIDFGAVRCADDSVAADNCLSALEVEVLERLYGGVQNGDGKIIYPSAPYGSEHYSDIWLFGTNLSPAWGVLASAGYRGMLASDLAEDDIPQGLATDRMVDWISRSSIPALTDATDSDLSGLREAGGKLLIYQGWSDPLIIPEPIVGYYEQAIEAAGGLEELQTYARLLMVPGLGHCWERPALAPDDFDPLQVLEQWVEDGLTPDYIIASQRGPEGEVLRSRRVCAYPATAQLVDIENPDSQENYLCVTGHEVKGD